MSDDYPMERQTEEAQIKKIPVRLDPAEFGDLEFVVAVWNEMNKAINRKGRAWMPMSVCRRLVMAGVERFLRKHGGWPSWDEDKGRPMNAEEREALTRRAIADVKKRK